MAQWNEAVNISGLHRLFETGGIALQQLAKGVVRKLQNTEAFASSDPELIGIMSLFGYIDEYSRLKDYNAALEMLYDYGNKEIYLSSGTAKQLWVEVEGPQEFDDIPVKTNNPFDEDTKPQFIKPHFHGPFAPTYKGPQAVSGGEWIKYNFGAEQNAPKSFYGHTSGCACDACLKARAGAKTPVKEVFEPWDKSKTYNIGDTVRYKNLNFKCLIACTNVDPDANSQNRSSDAWKFVAAAPPEVLDPTLAFTNRITCETKGKPYPTGRKFKYMSDDEFRKKLKLAEIDPPTVPKELYSYWKDSEEPYQDWLIQRWNNQNLTFRTPSTIH